MRNFVAAAGMIIGLIGAGTANAEDWRWAATAGTSQHPTSLFLVDADSIKTTGSGVRFWVDERFRAVSTSGYNRVMELIDADCEDQSYSELQIETYFAHTALENLGAGNRTYAIPGSMMGGTITRVCAGNYSSGLAPDQRNDPDELTKVLFGERWFTKRIVHQPSRQRHHPH